MLSLVVREGEYLMVGDVRVTFDRAETSDLIYVAVEAPKDMSVLRSKVYERHLEHDALVSGDTSELERVNAEKQKRLEWKRARNRKRAERRRDKESGGSAV